MKKLILISIILVLSASAFSQQSYVEKSKKYNLARVYTTNNKVHKVRNLQLINDTLVECRTAGMYTQEKLQFSVDDIKYISAKKGSHALGYGLWGAGIGAASVGLTHIMYGSKPSYKDFNWAPMYAGFTIGCGLVGAVIGAFCYKWERLYIEDNTKTSYLFYPNIGKDAYQMSLVVKLK